MKRNILTIFAFIFVFSITLFQGFLLVSFYNLQKESVVKDLDSVVETVYKRNTGARIVDGAQLTYKTPFIYDVSNVPASINKEEIPTYNINNSNDDDLITLMNIAFEEYASIYSSIDIHKLDSLIMNNLIEKNIYSDFCTQIITNENEVIESTKPDIGKDDLFVIVSKQIPLNLEKTKFIQVLLINPKKVIFQKLSLVVLSCLLFSLFCIYCIWFLQRTFSKQRKTTQLKNDLFSQISHELKRPVSQIIMSVDFLKNSKIMQNDFNREKYLNITQEASDDISNKIDMIMALGMEKENLFRLHCSFFNIENVVNHLIEKFQLTSKKPTEISFKNILDSNEIYGDETHISQSLSNLIENAIKYSKKEVKIDISVCSKENQILISIKDNGIGIDQINLKTVFERYNQVDKTKGFGIGLHYVKTIIEKHSGKVEVWSVLGAGSEFTVYLPKK